MNIPEFPTRCSVQIDSFSVTEEDLFQKLSTLDTGKATGPDKIHTWIVKEGRRGSCKPLAMLFNLSLKTGELPIDWRQALVIPIFKKGSRYYANNYRPVSLTSQVCKILEHFVSTFITRHLIQNNLLSQQQHGGRSCLTYLLTALNDWSSNLDNSVRTDVIYLDFQKAFHKVSHCRLLKKLEAYGIKGSLLMWINNFLINRVQQVGLKGSTSKTFSVSSGVPQGSVIGSLLFLVYNNDIPEHVGCSISMFADDTKIYTTDCRFLQTAGRFKLFSQMGL